MSQNVSHLSKNGSVIDEAQVPPSNGEQNRENVVSRWGRWMGRSVSRVGTALSDGLKKITSVFKSGHEKVAPSRAKGPVPEVGLPSREPKAVRAAGAYSLDRDHIPHARESIYAPREELDPPDHKNPFSSQEATLKSPIKRGALEKKHARFMSDDVSTTNGKVLLGSVLQAAYKNVTLGCTLNIYYSIKRALPENQGLSDIDIIGKDIAQGTCYGQAMNLLEILSSSYSENCSVESIMEHMDPRKSITYQIVHMLIAYLNGLEAEIFNFYKLNAKMMVADLEKIFPCYGKRKVSSEKISLGNMTQGDLSGHISDYLKLYTRPRDSENRSRDFIVVAELSNESEGHAALMYYSEKHKKYYWYDPFTWTGGFFSASNLREYLLGISERLIKYSQKQSSFSSENLWGLLPLPDIQFSHVHFIAYDPDDKNVKSRT